MPSKSQTILHVAFTCAILCIYVYYICYGLQFRRFFNKNLLYCTVVSYSIFCVCLFSFAYMHLRKYATNYVCMFTFLLAHLWGDRVLRSCCIHNKDVGVNDTIVHWFGSTWDRNVFSEYTSNEIWKHVKSVDRFKRQIVFGIIFMYNGIYRCLPLKYQLLENMYVKIVE